MNTTSDSTGEHGEGGFTVARRSRKAGLYVTLICVAVSFAAVWVLLSNRAGPGLREFVSPPLDSRGTVVRMLVPDGWTVASQSGPGAPGFYFIPQPCPSWLPYRFRRWLYERWNGRFVSIGFLLHQDGTSLQARRGFPRVTRGWGRWTLRTTRGFTAERYYRDGPGAAMLVVHFARPSQDDPDPRIQRILASVHVN